MSAKHVSPGLVHFVLCSTWSASRFGLASTVSSAFVLAREHEASGAIDREVQRPVADAVARQQQRSLAAAPPGDGERSRQELERARALGLEQLEQQARVAVGIAARRPAEPNAGRRRPLRPVVAAVREPRAHRLELRAACVTEDAVNRRHLSPLAHGALAGAMFGIGR
jgi:hypothetical protein